MNATLVTIAHVDARRVWRPSTLYHYRVKSRDAAGNLATSGDFTFTTRAAPPPPRRPACWRIGTFDDGAGTIAADASGNGRTGTLVNGPPGRRAE